MYFPHPLRVTVRQIIVNRDDMDAAAVQCVQIRRQCGDKRLTFTGLHLGDSSLMQDNTADQLYAVMLHAENTACSFSDRRKCLRQDVVQCLSGSKLLFEFTGMGTQLLV